MYIYKAKEMDLNGVKKMRYWRDNVITKESTVPHEVKEKLEYAPSVEYDEHPENLKRCLFCDAPGTRFRSLNLVILDLCEWHYQNMSLGKIAFQVNLIKKEQEKQWLLRKNTPVKARRKKRRMARQEKQNSTPLTLEKAATQ